MLGGAAVREATELGGEAIDRVAVRALARMIVASAGDERYLERREMPVVARDRDPRETDSGRDVPNAIRRQRVAIAARAGPGDVEMFATDRPRADADRRHPHGEVSELVEGRGEVPVTRAAESDACVSQQRGQPDPPRCFPAMDRGRDGNGQLFDAVAIDSRHPAGGDRENISQRRRRVVECGAGEIDWSPRGESSRTQHVPLSRRIRRTGAIRESAVFSPPSPVICRLLLRRSKPASRRVSLEALCTQSAKACAALSATEPWRTPIATGLSQ
ncbi:MAG TPA: hypothetical protein VGX69_01170 [Solirubrobacteraceae bacterium]|nr:hypothetical protein [Solirubrobacteraceae bacterium]